MHHVHHPSRQQIANQLHEHTDAKRRLFGRFQHHAVAPGQRRRQLPGCHQQREVPGDNLPHHAERFIDVIGHRVLVDFRHAAFLRAQATGKVAEMVGGQRDVGIQGFTDRLAIIPGFRQRQRFQMLLDAIGNRQQHIAALLHTGFPPCVCGGMGGVQRQLNILRVGARELRHIFTRYRCGIGEVVSGNRFNKFTANVIPITRFKSDTRTGLSRMNIFHGKLLIRK